MKIRRVGKEVKNFEFLFIIDGSGKCCNCYVKQYGNSPENCNRMSQQFHFCEYSPPNWKECLMEIFVHTGSIRIIHNGQEGEASQVSLDRWKTKQQVVYIYNRISFVP
jgi:hypothetical protein